MRVSQQIGGGYDYKVFVDGIRRSKIHGSETIRLDLAPGQHTIQVCWALFKSDVLALDVRNGHYEGLICGEVTGSFGLGRLVIRSSNGDPLSLSDVGKPFRALSPSFKKDQTERVPQFEAAAHILAVDSDHTLENTKTLIFVRDSDGHWYDESAHSVGADVTMDEAIGATAGTWRIASRHDLGPGRQSVTFIRMTSDEIWFARYGRHLDDVPTARTANTPETVPEDSCKYCGFVSPINLDHCPHCHLGFSYDRRRAYNQSRMGGSSGCLLPVLFTLTVIFAIVAEGSPLL